MASHICAREGQMAIFRQDRDGRECVFQLSRKKNIKKGHAIRPVCCFLLSLFWSRTYKKTRSSIYIYIYIYETIATYDGGSLVYLEISGRTKLLRFQQVWMVKKEPPQNKGNFETENNSSNICQDFTKFAQVSIIGHAISPSGVQHKINGRNTPNIPADNSPYSITTSEPSLLLFLSLFSFFLSIYAHDRRPNRFARHDGLKITFSVSISRRRRLKFSPCQNKFSTKKKFNQLWRRRNLTWRK